MDIKDGKKKGSELFEKASSKIGDVSERVDKMVDKRSHLGEWAAPMVSALLITLVFAVIKHTELLAVFIIVGLLAASPLIYKKIKANSHKKELDVSLPSVEATIIVEKKDEVKK